MASYRLSLLAEEDARRIYSFGIERFGLRKADSYFEGLFAQFHDIADAPLMYPAVDEISTGIVVASMGLIRSITDCRVI